MPMEKSVTAMMEASGANAAPNDRRAGAKRAAVHRRAGSEPCMATQSAVTTKSTMAAKPAMPAARLGRTAGEG